VVILQYQKVCLCIQIKVSFVVFFDFALVVDQGMPVKLAN